jgi:hypothetical protein
MPVYTVHAPATAAGSGPAAADRFVFIRDGFHGWAFVAGPFWLIYHRLWLVLGGYVALNVVLTVLLAGLNVDSGTRFAVMLLLGLLLALEAATLRRWTLSRQGWRQLDVVVADDQDGAERRFFDRWTAQAADSYQPPVERGMPPPARPPAASQAEIFGLFPRPGAPR